MTLDIIYRCCGKETGTLSHREIRPSWFCKLKCLKSICDMLPIGGFSLHIVYDGPDSVLLKYILNDSVNFESIIRVNDGSNASIKHQWPIADSLWGDYIYFVEDDYLHAPDAAKILMEGSDKFDLVTLYDHPDRYTRTDDVTKSHESVEITKSCHWRTAESTTSTFGISRGLWKEVRTTAIECGAHDRMFFRKLIERGYRLWTPMPAQSTHCFTEFLSPLRDWQKIAEAITI